jgi:hypothetical protein
VGVASLKRLASYLDPRIEKRTELTLCEGLINFATDPEPDHAELMHILSKRLVDLETVDPEIIEMFVDTDIMHSCLDKSDYEGMEDFVRKSTKKAKEREEYTKEFTARQKTQRQHDEVELELAGDAGALPRQPRADALGALQSLPDGMFSQQQLKALVPHGGSIWIGHKEGCYAGHFPPFKRQSAKWSLYGQRNAAIKVLRYLWKGFCTYHGYQLTDCPISGLFGAGAGGVLPTGPADVGAPG